MKKVLIAAAAYAGVGLAAELAFLAALHRKYPGRFRFDVTNALLWPALAYNVVTGKTVLSLAPGLEPARPTATGAVPFNATNRIAPPGAVGVSVTRSSDGAAEGVSVGSVFTNR